MGAAAAPLLAESVMAESFAVAAPTMFTAAELAPLATGALETGVGLGALEGFGGLSALGAEFGTEALFGGLGEAAASTIPTLGEGIASGVTSGGLGAGEAGINEALVNAEQMQAVNSGFSQAEIEAMQQGQELARASSAAPPLEEVAGQGLKTSMMNAPTASGSAYELTGANPNIPNPAYDLSYRAPVDGLSMGGGEGIKTAMTELPKPAPSALESGFNTAIDFAKKNPFSAASMAYSGTKLLGGGSGGGMPEKEEYNGPLSKYKMSPNFQGRHVNPEDYQYTPKTYAEGGIASFKSGGKSDLDPTGGSKIADDYYESMLRQQAQNMPSTKSDMGIYYDLDPDTRYLDPVSAAQIRMAKINKRSNVQAQNMKRPTPMGRINLAPANTKAEAASSSIDPETMAAQGGIMHANLGGYAAGGNPRLLRGPGDGMSDNIPATIAGKQPARLADGEFVIPADVVSHLGNGSTEAGAKILHAMMTKVRKERTGNPKQGKQINPRKFVPT